MSEISVIVPVYNTEKYIKRCVDSILNQTFIDFELILLDDGSTDNSGKICDDYLKKDMRIRVVHQNNRGQAATRNHGVELALCDWISFIDSDDVVHPQYLEFLYQAVCEKNVKISGCHIYERDLLQKEFFEEQNIQITNYLINEQMLLQCFFGTNEEISKYMYWVVWGKLIYKNILLKYPFTSNRIYEDNAVVFKWLYESANIAFCNNVLYFYFVNADGTTKSRYSLKRLDWLWAFREQIDFYHKVGYNKFETMLRKRYIWEALREYDHINTILKNKHIAKKLRKHIMLYWKENRKKMNMSYNERMDILSRLYPNLIKRLSKIKRILVFGDCSLK